MALGRNARVHDPPSEPRVTGRSCSRGGFAKHIIPRRSPPAYTSGRAKAQGEMLRRVVTLLTRLCDVPLAAWPTYPCNQRGHQRPPMRHPPKASNNHNRRNIALSASRPPRAACNPNNFFQRWPTRLEPSGEQSARDTPGRECQKPACIHSQASPRGTSRQAHTGAGQRKQQGLHLLFCASPLNQSLAPEELDAHAFVCEQSWCIRPTQRRQVAPLRPSIRSTSNCDDVRSHQSPQMEHAHRASKKASSSPELKHTPAKPCKHCARQSRAAYEGGNVSACLHIQLVQYWTLHEDRWKTNAWGAPCKRPFTALRAAALETPREEEASCKAWLLATPLSGEACRFELLRNKGHVRDMAAQMRI